MGNWATRAANSARLHSLCSKSGMDGKENRFRRGGAYFSAAFGAFFARGAAGFLALATASALATGALAGAAGVSGFAGFSGFSDAIAVVTACLN